MKIKHIALATLIVIFIVGLVVFLKPFNLQEFDASKGVFRSNKYAYKFNLNDPSPNITVQKEGESNWKLMAYLNPDDVTAGKSELKFILCKTEQCINDFVTNETSKPRYTVVLDRCHVKDTGFSTLCPHDLMAKLRFKKCAVFLPQDSFPGVCAQWHAS